MIYGKKYVFRWTPQLKRSIILTLAACFILGMLLGLIVGCSVNTQEKDVVPNVTPSTTLEISDTSDISRTEVSTPTPETTPFVEQSTSVTTIPEITETVYYDVPLSDDLQDYIIMLCEEAEIPVALVLGLIETESSFRPNVISGSNDYGLMQINKINHEWMSEKYGITDFLDPYQNVFCGITILSGHYERFEDMDKALMAYNLGATGAKRLWDKGVYTTSYVEKVKGAMAKYDQT